MDHFMLDKVLSVRKRTLLTDCPVYLIAEADLFGDSEAGQQQLVDAVTSSLQGGIRMLLLSGPSDTPTRRWLSLARQLRSLTREFETLFLVRQRADVALAVEADGVHLDLQDMDVLTARKILGPERIIGSFVHTPNEAQQMLAQEVDYLCAGPVFASELVPGQLPVGLPFIQWMAQNVQLPWFAAGGIDLACLPTVQDAGAARIAVTRCLLKSRQPAEAAEALLQQLTTPSPVVRSC